MTWTVLFGVVGNAKGAENDDSLQSFLRNGRNLPGFVCKSTSGSKWVPDDGCDSDYPFCVFENGIEVPNGKAGDQCVKCKRNSRYGLDDGCHEDEPYCVISVGEMAGMECSASSDDGSDWEGGGSSWDGPGCRNDRVDRLPDDGCHPLAPFCVKKNGDETPIHDAGHHCRSCPLATGWHAKKILRLSDQDLWDSAANGNVIGLYCKIEFKEESGFWYATGRPGLQGDGVPRSCFSDGGNGLIDGDGPYYCYIQNSHWISWKYDYIDDDPLADRAQMCTEDLVHNGAEQIRWALNNGYCDDFCEDKNIRFPNH